MRRLALALPLSPLAALSALSALATTAALASCGSTDASEGQAPSHAAVKSAVTACPDGAIATGGACTSFVARTCDLPGVPAPGAVEFVTDRVYATPGRGTPDAAPQTLDIARPRLGAGTGDPPTALFVHGGAWNSGDKTGHRDDILRLAALGWVAVSVNYRLVQPPGKNRFPAGVSDVRCAVRWLRAHASEVGASSTRIVALGESAGAELVELLGTAPQAAGLDDGQCEESGAVSVEGVVAFSGRSELATPPVPDYVVDYIGRDADWQSRERLASAVDHVDAHAAPMLLVHGQNDTRVPITQSRVLRDALRKAGVPVGLVEIPGAGHNIPIFGGKGNLAPAACSTLAFLHHFR